MTRAYISKLSEDRQRELFDDLNYLNLSEIKSLCKRHSIPFKIAIETGDGRTVLTKDDDRKGVILNRLRNFLATGVVPEGTRFPANVVCSEPLRGSLSAGDRLYYGQYDKTNRAMIALLEKLTAGRFKNGAIARILAREFWSRGQAPTFAEFAAAWSQAAKNHTDPNPEWAFLADRARGEDMKNWKQLRAQKASGVLGMLNRLTSSAQE
jgi:hypothetical protein